MTICSRALRYLAHAGLAVGALAVGAPSFAYTQCTGHITEIYTGDGGTVWVVMDNTVQWYVGPTDPNVKNILSSATTALALGNAITVRFQADAVTCGSGAARGDVLGMYLTNSP
jgi:hypothetical protein